MLEKLIALLAAFGTGANKGFWVVQPRDDEGRWMEMGRGSLTFFRLADGTIVEAVGTFIGGTGRLGNGAVLIKGHDFVPDGVYELTSKHMHRVDAFIPESVLKRQGIKKSSVVTDPTKIAGKTIADLPSTPRRDITPDDERIAAGDLTDEEKANIEEGRANSPLANLPAGYEVDNPEEVEQMLRDAGIDLEGAAQVGEEKSGFKKAAAAKSETPRDITETKPEDAGKLTDDELFDLVETFMNYARVPGEESGFEPLERAVYEEIRNRGLKATDAFDRFDKKTPEEPAADKEGDYSKLSGPELDKLISDTSSQKESLEKSSKALNEAKRRAKLRGEKYSNFTGAPEPTDDLEKAMEQGFKATGPFGFNGYRSKKAEENKEVYDKVGENGYQTTLSKNEDGSWTLDSRDEFGKNKESNTFDSIEDALARAKEIDNKLFETPAAERIGDIDAAVEKAIQDAIAGKMVDLDNLIKKSGGTPIGKGFSFEEDDEGDGEEAKKPEKAAKAKKTPAAKSSEDRVPAKRKTVTKEELSALARPEDFEKYFGFTPSEEQTLIIAAIVRANVDTAVAAGAGAGKTTTYVGITRALYEEQPDARVALLQLNRTNADEAAKLVPRNTISNTVDAYFGRPHIVAMAQGKTGKLKGSANDPHVGRYMSESNFHLSGAQDIGSHFLMDEMSIGGEQYDVPKVAALVMAAVDRFAQSTDSKVGPQHFNVKTKAKKGETAEDVEIEDDKLKKLVSYAEAYWEDLTHVPTWDERASYTKKDGTKGLKFTKGVTAISPTHAFKMWALSDPDLSKLKSEDGKPITHIFLDEAQDTNAVFEKVITDNINRGTAPLVAMVGDRAQSIYEFRGSRDALTTFAKNLAGANLTLTTTRRFGEELLPNANGFLNLLGEGYRLKSEVGGGEILDNEDISLIPDAKGNTAIQTRTNAGVFEQIEKYDQLGYKVGVTQNMYKDLTDATAHLEWLSQDFNSRSKKPPKFSQDFRGMRSLKALIDAAEIQPQSRAGFWWRLIQEDPESKIKKLKELAEKVIVEREQLDVESVTNLKGTSGSSGEFNGIAWSIDGDTIVLSDAVKYAMFGAIPGRDDKKFRDVVVGQKANTYKKIPAMEPELKLSDGTTPEWRVRKDSDGKWLTTLVVPDDAMREDYLNKMASLFMADTEAPVVADVLVSTAHRFKGLEKDNIIIGPDFPNPKLDDKGNLVMPGRDEYQLGYVAVTRPRKRIFYGSLAYGLDYTGENGMRKANEDLGRDPELGLDVIKREEEAQAKLTAKRNNKGKDGGSLKSGKGQNFAGGFQFSEEDDETPSNMEQIVDQNPFATTTVPVTRSTSPGGSGKKLIAGWALLRNGTYSSRVDGTTWNIRENKDGTIVARPRTNEDRLGSFKFNSWDQLENNFPTLQDKAIKANRNVLKDKIKPFDVNGDIARAIDNGADPDDIVSMISKTDEFSDAIDKGDVNFVSIFAAVDNVGSTKLTNPKTAKPKKAAPKKASTPTSVVNSTYYNMFPNDHMSPQLEFSIFDGPKVPLEDMLKVRTSSDVTKSIEKLIDFGAKINPDGSVTLHRAVTEETSGPRAGSKVALEMRWTPNKATSGTHSYIVTDLETGEKEEYWDYSPTHSFNRILTGGKRRLDTYWNADPSTLPSNQNPDTYGGVYGAINRLRTGFTQGSARKGAGGLARLLEDKTASDTNVKLRTPLEHVTIAMNGRDSRLNNSKRNFHTIQRKGIDSVFDAIEVGEIDAAVGAIREYINNIPNTPDAQRVVKDYLRATVKRRLPDMSTNKLNAMLDDAFDIIDSSDPIPTTSVVKPHLSKNGVLVQPGQQVRWSNNIKGDAVGTVESLVPYDNPDGGRRTYADFVEVSFKGREGTVRLNSKNMSVVEDDVESTEYQPWLRELDLALERAEVRGWTYDPMTNKFYDKGVEVKDLVAFAGPATYPLTISSSIKKPVKDVNVGDILYDEDKNLYGKVAGITSGFGRDADGNRIKGFKVSFEPQDNQPNIFFPASEQLNVPKPKEAAKPTTSNPDLAAQAADLGLAPGADGTSSGKKISTHPTTDDPDTNTPIKASSRKAIKPTDEAKDILEKQLALGEQAWNETEPRIIDELNAMGYNIKPGTKYEDLDQAVANEYTKRLKARDKASKDLSDMLSQEKNDAASNQASIAQRMTADNLYDANGVDFAALSKKLRDAGLEDYSYEIRGASNDVDGFSAQLAGMAAYQILNDPRKKTQASRLWRSNADKNNEFNKSKRAKSEFEDNLAEATKNATKKTLEDLGVQFDNVSLDEFEGNIISVQDKQPLDALSTFKSARALTAAFDYMPANRIRQLAKYLKDTGGKLQIISGVKRGHFRPLSNGDVEITLSTARGTKANDSTALHELQHFLDFVDQNGNAAAHTWLYSRALNADGQTLRPLMTWGKGETGFAITDLKSPYTTRRYERDNFVLDPNFDGNEVNSTIMEDLFLDAGSVSRPNGQYAIVKKTRQKTNRKTGAPVVDKKTGDPVMEDYYDFAFDPFYDEKENKWYADETKAEELNVRDWYGRKKSAGLDRNVKHYGMGMLLMMNDWSATTGLGD